MTTTYDPAHPAYLSDSDLRAEFTRVFDHCHGCRMCLHYCPSFPALFDAVDRHDGDVGALERSEADKVVAECFQCKICAVKCPYMPPHEWALDFPRLMMRANAVRHNSGDKALSERVTDKILGEADLLGKLGSLSAKASLSSTMYPGSLGRRAMESIGGISSKRLLPPYAKTRFSVWFRSRLQPYLAHKRATVAIFPTCFVEYMEPQVGQDLVEVCERNQVGCELAKGAGCCGAPKLHSGDVDGFIAAARRNLPSLVDQVRQGRPILVTQPTCGYVLKRDYPLYLNTPDAQEVAANTFDAGEYLLNMHKRGGGLDLDLKEFLPEKITYHSACHLQAQSIGLRTRDLLKAAGSQVSVVAKCSGIDGTWGYRAANYEASKKISTALGSAISKAGSESIVGDCHLANTAITEEVHRPVKHPLSLLAEAYRSRDDGPRPTSP